MEAFYTAFTKTFNLFELTDLCKEYKLQILARDTNHTSCIVKTKTGKFYLSDGKVERI